MHIKLIDKSRLKVIYDHSEMDIKRKIEKTFRGRPEGYQFMPLYKERRWDGWVRFVSISGVLQIGLFIDLVRFLLANNIKPTIDPKIKEIFTRKRTIDLEPFLQTLDLPFQPYDYQLEALNLGATQRMVSIFSTMGTGKSFMIYLIILYHIRVFKLKPVIIVPTTNLVDQLWDDFISYGYKGQEPGRYYAGSNPNPENIPFAITTWQSMSRKGKKFCNTFASVIVDEMDTAEGKVLFKLISEKLSHCQRRVGLTGTMANSDIVKELTLKSLFGDTNTLVKMEEAIEDGYNSDLLIDCIQLKYLDFSENQLRFGYQEETKTSKKLLEHRKEFTNNLVKDLEGVTIVFSKKVEPIRDMYNRSEVKNKYLITGSVPPKERYKMIREVIEGDEDAVIFATFQVIGRGQNIKRVNNVVLFDGGKSKKMIFQAIGRGMRVTEDQNKICMVYDISDNSFYSSEHAKIRMSLYVDEGLQYEYIEHEISKEQLF